MALSGSPGKPGHSAVLRSPERARVENVTGFLLARDTGTLRTSGAATRYGSSAAAADALRTGGAELVVGALPFDPARPAALFTPVSARFSPGRWRPTETPAVPAVRVIQEIPSPAEHIARVAKLTELIGDTALRKVVAARSIVISADSDINPEAVVARLAITQPAASVFLATLPGAGTLVGATPELLVARHGTTVTLTPLAGTTARRPDPVADQAASVALLNSAKNKEEHAYVIDWIRERLSPYCVLTIPEHPRLAATPQVWHLATPIRGELRDPATTALELATVLHPTPAVGGTPTDLALQTLAAIEEDRRFYGGAAGWCDARGDGEWVVTIRCAEIAPDRRTARAWAGGGLVAASNPQAELDETTTKLGTLLSAFT